MPHVPNEFGVKPMLSIGGYYPADVRAAYRMPASGGSGVIAIVDAFNDPTALSDFNGFSAQFGLPQETNTVATAKTNKVFQIVYATGTKPADDTTGWSSEISLDIEWAHAMAPNAKIVLVEGADDSSLDAAVAVAKAITGVHEVSMNSPVLPLRIPCMRRMASPSSHRRATPPMNSATRPSTRMWSRSAERAFT